MFKTRSAVAVCRRILCNRSFSSLNCFTKLPLLRHNYNDHQTTVEIDGKLIANDIKVTLATEVNHMKNSIKKAPGLGVILVGKRKDSRSFVRIKKKACEEVGITSVVLELPEDCTEGEVLDVVSVLNHKESIHGILVQLPLPCHLSERKILNAVNVEKDVDGFHPVNIGNLAMTDREPLFVPCASRGCIEVLHRCGVEIIDVGVPNLVRGHWLKSGVVVVDMGSTLVTDSKGSRVTGDVCYEEAILKASLITPVPGGVGPVTISMLLYNTVEAAKRAYQWTEKS